jgi:hypothetical protein
MLVPTTIIDSRLSPYMCINMELQEREMQSRHDAWTMNRVVWHHHGGSFLRISWDPEILARDNATVNTEVRANFYCHEIGSLEKLYIDGLTELL